MQIIISSIRKHDKNEYQVRYVEAPVKKRNNQFHNSFIQAKDELMAYIEFLAVCRCAGYEIVNKEQTDGNDTGKKT